MSSTPTITRTTGTTTAYTPTSPRVSVSRPAPRGPAAPSQTPRATRTATSRQATPSTSWPWPSNRRAQGVDVFRATAVRDLDDVEPFDGFADRVPDDFEVGRDEDRGR
jgi:hypothetical protein